MPTRPLTAKAEIQAYLETDHDYAAFSIGDLDDGYFEQCTWHVAEENHIVCALAQVYKGFHPPVLFVMGTGDGLAALFGGPVQTERAYVTARKEHLTALGAYYHWDKLRPMWRMVLRLDRFSNPVGPCQQLGAKDAGRLRALCALGDVGDFFDPTQLSRGVFYGIEQDGQLVATAGTYLVSAKYGVGAVGPVMTHPDYRGRQYAALVTGAVCAELVRRGITTVFLNVRQGNAPAIHVYEKLGFVRHCAFYEGVIERR